MKRYFLILFFSLGSIVVMSQDNDRWFLLNLGDKPVGYYRESSKISITEVSTRIEMKMKLSRLGSEVVLDSKQIFLESGTGDLKKIGTELLFSKQLNRTNAEVGESSVTMTSTTGGKETVNTIPYSGKLIGNEGLRLMTIKSLKKLGDSIVYKTFIPEYAMVIDGIRKFIAEEFIEIKGQLIKAKKVKDTFKGLPISRTSWLDNEAHLLKSSEPNPFGKMTLIISDEKSVMAITNNKIELSENQYNASLARSNVRLPEAREIEAVTIKIKHKNPELGFPDLAGPYQKIVESKGDYVILQLRRTVPGKLKETLSMEQLKPFIHSSSFLNTEDTLVIKTMKSIVGNESDQLTKALLIRNWVSKNMKMEPGIALAPSSEVMRNLAGTCASYATITTTLCRAAGIPTRYLAGYTYLEGIWGGHAWAEVYINETWIPIDAALTSTDLAADAARFYFGRSSGVNGVSDSFIGAAQLFSNVDIEILDYNVNGKLIKPEKELYTNDALGYANPGLGIKVKPMAGFSFKELDNFYPNKLLFKLTHEKSGESISFFQHFITPKAGFKTIAEEYFRKSEITAAPMQTEFKKLMSLKGQNKTNVVYAIRNGTDVFVIVANGEAPEKLLDNMLKGLSIVKY